MPNWPCTKQRRYLWSSSYFLCEFQAYSPIPLLSRSFQRWLSTAYSPASHTCTYRLMPEISVVGGCSNHGHYDYSCKQQRIYVSLFQRRTEHSHSLYKYALCVQCGGGIHLSLRLLLSTFAICSMATLYVSYLLHYIAACCMLRLYKSTLQPSCNTRTCLEHG